MGTTRGGASVPRPEPPSWNLATFAILVGVLLAISVVAGVFIYDAETAPSPAICTALECGGYIALNTPTESNHSGTWIYNFSVAAAPGDLPLADLGLLVQDQRGANLTPAADWSLTVYGLTGSTLATFSLVQGVWTSGASTILASQQIISLDSGSQSLSGDNLLVIGHGSYQGSVSVSIP
jgi:hypothetical protein